MPESSRLFFRLLVVGSIMFLVTCFAYSLPFDHLPPWFQEYGWLVLLVEVGFLMILGLLSMSFDQKPER
ncbi:MAG TPA: hypothetical protein PKD86_05130 [Gemmatales bacterium]|nr:hypothetical protein [Gemmatales bacterium]HMP58716.1 hypothetical protein [Gemmatales bacterium]